MTDQPGRQIPLSYLLTPQEQFFMGGSPGDSPEPYIPIGVFGFHWDPESRFPLNEIARERERLRSFQSNPAGSALGLGGSAVVSLSGLDTNGRTLIDPKILGYMDPESEELVIVSDRDLTREFVAKYKESGIEIPMRGLGGETEPPRDISLK